MQERFYASWRQMRVWALIAAGLIALACTIKSYAFNLEIEFRGPGSEIERFEKQDRDNENEKASERCSRGEGTERDREHASEYEREHSA